MADHIVEIADGFWEREIYPVVRNMILSTE